MQWTHTSLTNTWENVILIKTQFIKLIRYTGEEERERDEPNTIKYWNQVKQVIR